MDKIRPFVITFAILLIFIPEIRCIQYSWKWTITIQEKQPNTLAAITFNSPQTPDHGFAYLDEFVGGRNYSSSQSFELIKGAIENVKVKAHHVVPNNGTCPPAKGAKSLKLDRITVRYTATNKEVQTTYEKHLTSVELPLLCDTPNSTNGTKVIELKDFKKLPSDQIDCYINNHYYEHGEEFEQDCTGSCECNSGGVHCSSLCAPYTADWSKCHIVKPYGHCCTVAECADDLSDQQCDTLEVKGRSRLPWAVGLVSSNDTKSSSANTVCSGAIIDKNWILTRASCVKNAKITKIVHPIAVAESVNVTEIVFYNADNETAKSHLALVKVEPEIAYTHTIHEVNFPLRSECRAYADSSCQYYLTSFQDAKNAGEFNVLQAKRTDAGRCSSHKGVRPLTCLQIDQYPQCPNLEGGLVTVQRSEKFYAVGFLLDAGRKYDTGCDINRSQYRSMINICQRFDWIVNVTNIKE